MYYSDVWRNIGRAKNEVFVQHMLFFRVMWTRFNAQIADLARIQSPNKIFGT